MCPYFNLSLFEFRVGSHCFFSFSFVIPIPFQPSHLFRTLLPCIELYRLLCNNQISIFCTIFNIQLYLLQSSCFRSSSTQMLRHNLLLRGTTVGWLFQYVCIFFQLTLTLLVVQHIYLYIQSQTFIMLLRTLKYLSKLQSVSVLHFIASYLIFCCVCFFFINSLGFFVSLYKLLNCSQFLSCRHPVANSLSRH